MFLVVNINFIRHFLFEANSGKLAEIDGRLKRAEDVCGENKNALTQLIGHTKNVERAVTTGQQDIINKKDQQSQK